MARLVICTMAALLTSVALAYDVDVTFIDRLPTYAFDAPKNQPADGDSVSFVGHVKLDHSAALTAPYVWYLDGIELASGTKNLLPDTDNTVSAPWIWDSNRHEVMLTVNLAQAHLEDSDQNNIVFDFTDALIVGLAVEEGLVDAFPTFQTPLDIGSQSFEDWYQRMIRIWNLMLMEEASNLDKSETVDVKDRVRGVVSYHADGTLSGGNCPVEWKQVDMLWGKLASDAAWYQSQRLFWFFEWPLPHELTHARYLPDTYVFDMGAAGIEVIDDSGLNVAETPYMPQYSWGIVYYNKSQNGMMGGEGFRYGLFSGYLWNRVAGQRALGCNTNGCCGHNTEWRSELPATMRLKILDLNGTPWVGARLDVYTRIGAYWPYMIDNEIDFTMYTDSNGLAILPPEVFSDVGLFILKIVSPDESKREYRYLERTDFHIAFWSGSPGPYDHVIQTDFHLPPTAENLVNRSGARSETFEITFLGNGFKRDQRFVFGDPAASIGDISWISENEVRVTLTHPDDLVMGQRFRLCNPDGKFVRVKDPYQQAINLEFPDAKPYARFLVYLVGGSDATTRYFNGLWSDDWSRLYHNDGTYPQPGTGPIVGYSWDFGDGTNSSDPFVVHRFPGAGRYTVSLTVIDRDGLTDTMTQIVEVAGLFTDGFESGDTSAWFRAVP